MSLTETIEDRIQDIRFAQTAKDALQAYAEGATALAGLINREREQIQLVLALSSKLAEFGDTRSAAKLVCLAGQLEVARINRLIAEINRGTITR